MNIKDLLPQRGHFLLLSRLTATQPVITGQALFSYDCLFAQNFRGEKCLPPLIVLEALLQCGGAGLRQAGLTPPGIFILTRLERVKIRMAPPLPATIDLTARTLKAGRRTIRQSGEAHLSGQFVLSARWTCVYSR